MPGSAHRDIQALLPWYVTGQLDAADRALVAAHLGDCEDCTAQLEIDRRLERAVTRVPNEVEAGWAAMSARLDAPARRRLRASSSLAAPASPPLAAPASPSLAARAPRRAGSGGGWRWIGWGIAAQLAVASVVGIAFIGVSNPPADFRVLGTREAPVASGNLIVIFRPETSERQFRETLRANAARLVDGPTAANAYVLAVPSERRTALLASLRAAPHVLLAEPIDQAS